MVEQTLKYRKKNSVVRNDFLQLMSELMTNLNDFTIVDVVAHAASFLLDGYETSSIVFSFLLYELAINLQVQDKLRREINETQLSYESLQEMSYLEAVFNGKLTKQNHFPK